MQFIVRPRPWCATSSWQAWMMSRVTWAFLGRMTGCFSSRDSSECRNFPPALNMPLSSISGSNLISWSFGFRCRASLTGVSMPCFRIFICPGNAAHCIALMMTFSASCRPSTVCVVCLLSVFSLLTRRLSLRTYAMQFAIACFALNQSEKRARRASISNDSGCSVAKHHFYLRIIGAVYFLNWVFFYVTLPMHWPQEIRTRKSSSVVHKATSCEAPWCTVFWLSAAWT